MTEKYSLAYAILLFPYHFYKDDYFNISYKYYEGLDKQIMNIKKNDAIEQRYLLIKNDYIYLNDEFKEYVMQEFLKLSLFNKKYIYEKTCKGIENFFKLSPYKKIVEYYLKYLEIQLKIESNNKVTDIEKNIINEMNALIINNPNLIEVYAIVQIFKSCFVDDSLKLQLINLFYQLGKNNLVVDFFESVSEKHLIDLETYLKISSSYFLIRKYDISYSILKELKNKNNKNKNYLLMIEIIELIYAFETRSTLDSNTIIEKFNEIAKNVTPYSDCAKLVLKFSSSILPHNEAINFIISSNINASNYQVYNNLGALYMAEGYKKFLVNHKDKKYFNKAKTCLEFAKFLLEEKKEYSAYLELNILTLRFFKESQKKSFTKNYSTIYNKFKKLINVADSSYFLSIVYCNCYILELLTNSNNKLKRDYLEKIHKIRNETNDIELKEKIDSFLSYNLRCKYIPIWVITETHF